MKIHLTQTGRNFDKTVLVHGNEILVNVRNFAKKIEIYGRKGGGKFEL